MKRLISLILVILTCFSFNVCSLHASASETKGTPETAGYEADGITGVQEGGRMHFECFGLDVIFPERIEGGYINDEMPETIAELDELIASEGSCGVCWIDFNSKDGDGSFDVQIMSCDEGTNESDVINYYLDWFSNAIGAKDAEMREIRIGDNEEQKCAVIGYINEGGDEEFFLVFDKVFGRYRIECGVRTYGWNGVEEKAQEVFFLDKPHEYTEDMHETSGTVGRLTGKTLRFDDFGLTAEAPDGAAEEWAGRPIPETFDSLDRLLEDNECYNVFWTDFETEDGSACISATLMPVEGAMSEKDPINYLKLYYLNELNASEAEIAEIPLGDNPKQKCLLVTFVNDDGVEENRLIFDKVHGSYYLECGLSTRGWKGAAGLAKDLFKVDAPMTAGQFLFADSGLFILGNMSVFGKTVDELRAVIGYFADPVEFPWWGENLSYSVVDLYDEPVWLLFNSDGKLYCAMNEDISGDFYESVLADAESRYPVYYYLDSALKSFSADGRWYHFSVNDGCRMQITKCVNENGGFGISQRIFGEPVFENDLLNFARRISNGECPDFTIEHAVSIAEFVAEQGNSNGMVELGKIQAVNFNDEISALQWYEKAADLGNPAGLANCGWYYSGACADIEPDYNKSADCFLKTLQTDDEDAKDYARERLFSLWVDHARELAPETLKKVDDFVVDLYETDPGGFSPAAVDMIRLLMESTGRCNDGK